MEMMWPLAKCSAKDSGKCWRGEGRGWGGSAVVHGVVNRLTHSLTPKVILTSFVRNLSRFEPEATEVPPMSSLENLGRSCDGNAAEESRAKGFVAEQEPHPDGMNTSAQL